MRLLFDQNLSFRLVERLRDLYPETKHVRDVGLTAADDGDVWAYARENEYVIVSKDEDFHQLSFLHGAPSKVIWIRIGNCTTAAIEGVLRDQYSTIVRFHSDAQGAFLVLGSGGA